MFVPMHSQPALDAGCTPLYPVIRGSSDMLLTLVPNQNLGMDAEPRPRGEKPLPPPRDARKTPPGKHGHKAYGADERRALDNLIETTGNGDGKK